METEFGSEATLEAYDLKIIGKLFCSMLLALCCSSAQHVFVFMRKRRYVLSRINSYAFPTLIAPKFYDTSAGLPLCFVKLVYNFGRSSFLILLSGVFN